MKENLEKVKKIIVKHDNIFFCIIFFIIVFGIDIYIKTVPTDEMWNFQNIYKMYNGYKIYIDANVVTTPIFHFIGMIIFKLFGANFFVFKIYGIVINLLLLFFTYKIFKSLKMPKYISLFFTIILCIAEMATIHNTANYSNLCMVFTLYGILIIFNRDSYSDNKFVLKEALLSVMILLTKQNIGVFYIFSFIIYIFLYEKRKHKVNNSIKYISIISLFLMIFILFMYKYGILDGFISYAVLGIKEFAINNLAIEKNVIKLFVISIVSLVLLIIFNINKNKIVDFNEIKNLNIISCFAFPFLMIAYPIFNVSHIDLALFLVYISLIYDIYILFRDLLFNRVIICKLLKFLIVLLVTISVIRIFLYLYKVDYRYSYNNLYFGSRLSEENKIKIDKVVEFIKQSEDDVIVFSTEAAMYMMPLNRSNGNMDEPLLGNFGKDGEHGVIESISKMKNTKILIDKEKKVYQESDKIINYIKENLIYIGDICDLLIYETKR